MQFKNFQNIMSDHKSRNARAGSYDFLFNYILNKITQTRYFVRARILPVLGLVFFQSPMFAMQTFNQVCVAFNLFLFFAFFLSTSTMLWFDEANRLSAIFFHFGVQIWCFPSVSIATSVLHSITWIAFYNLFMHSPLANQKQDIFLSTCICDNCTSFNC